MEAAEKNSPSILSNMDIWVAVGIMGVLMIMIIPLPTMMLDACLAVIITLSVLIILVTIYAA